jgi:hypothetical protein
MEGFERLPDIDPFVLKSISDNKVILFSRLDQAGFVIDMVEDKEPKSY